MALDRATVAVTDTDGDDSYDNFTFYRNQLSIGEHFNLSSSYACHVGTNDLKSAAQVVEECKKVNRALGIISRTIKYKRKSVLLNLYKTLARPHYCTPVCMVSTLRQR